MIDLSIGILSYNSPKTLTKTLESYKSNGLLNLVREKLLYVQPSENSHELIDIGIRYGFNSSEIFLAQSNDWIGPAFKYMSENFNSETILLLEDDFELIESLQTTKNILESGVNLLNDGEVDCVRLRSRYNPGDPLYSSHIKGNETNHSTHLAECVHWRENPDTDFPNYCKKISDDPLWYKFSSKYANFTNNPCIYRRSFYRVHIASNFCGKGNIEDVATEWWSERNFKVISGNGLFKHDRIDGK